MERADLARWIDGYERAWRTAGTSDLPRLFTDDVTYRPGPFDEPVVGLAALAAFWEGERDGPDEPFTLAWEPVAIEDEVGVARVEVVYTGPPERMYRDLWIVRVSADGRCRVFEEWPFFPGQPLSAR